MRRLTAVRHCDQPGTIPGPLSEDLRERDPDAQEGRRDELCLRPGRGGAIGRGASGGEFPPRGAAPRAGGSLPSRPTGPRPGAGVGMETRFAGGSGSARARPRHPGRTFVALRGSHRSLPHGYRVDVDHRGDGAQVRPDLFECAQPHGAVSGVHLRPEHAFPCGVDAAALPRDFRGHQGARGRGALGAQRRDVDRVRLQPDGGRSDGAAVPAGDRLHPRAFRLHAGHVLASRHFRIQRGHSPDHAGMRVALLPDHEADLERGEHLPVRYVPLAGARWIRSAGPFQRHPVLARPADAAGQTARRRPARLPHGGEPHPAQRPQRPPAHLLRDG